MDPISLMIAFGLNASKVEMAATDEKLVGVQLPAARSWRHIVQAVFPDEATAERVAARVRSGESLTQAVSDTGLTGDDIDIGDVTQQRFAEISSAPIAQVVFSAPSGSLVGPYHSDLGWHVIISFEAGH